MSKTTLKTRTGYTPIVFSEKIGYKLAVGQAGDVKLGIREAIANGLDAERKLGVKGRIDIVLDNDFLIFEDYGIGLTATEIARFKLSGHDSEGDGTIGFYGLGKFSICALGKAFEAKYDSNNGEYGYTISIVSSKDENATFDESPGKVDAYLSHRGTRVTIPNPKITADDIIKVVKERFSLDMLERGTTITLNGKAITPTFKFDLADKKHIQTMRGGAKITGALIQDEKGDGGVDIYVKHIFINHTIIDPSRIVRGWINCDSLIPSVSRTEINSEDGMFDELKGRLAAEFRRFPKRAQEKEISNSEMFKFLSDFAADFISTHNLLKVPPTLKYNQNGKDQKPFLSASEDGLLQLGEKRDGAGGSNNSGSQKAAKEGKDTKKAEKTKPTPPFAIVPNADAPLIYIERNVFVVNSLHWLYNNVLKKGSHAYKPVLFQQVARALAQLKAENQSMSAKEQAKIADDIVAQMYQESDQ